MKFSVLGANINDLNSYREAYDLLLVYLGSQNKPAYITVNNVHTVTEGFKDKDFRDIINNSYLALPDGRPLSIVGKLKGNNRVQRIFGPSFFEKALEWGVTDNLKHFFFGCSQDTLDKLKINAEKKFPGINIIGMISPPFRELSKEDNEGYLSEINGCKPDIVWVSLGAPKQERWVYSNYKYLNKGVMIGIGAGFNYLSGKLSHAPDWMKDYSLEWIYRIKQEPGRLWKRYLLRNPQFIFFVLLELLGMKKVK